ncbi:MAG: DnaD domain protein [Lachnospiraceae bacterium]|nr:DnaD domain protein [Lachnospiraceae bacterium]
MRIDIHSENHITDGDRVTFPAGFLARNLAPANGEFLKVYLLLLQAAQAGEPIEETDIADRLDATLKDVRRALRYWKQRGEIDLRRTGETLVLTFTPERAGAAGSGPEAASAKTQAEERAAALRSLRSDREFSQLLFVIEKYRGEKFTPTHLETVAYWYSTLGMPAELIENIVESCAEAGHTSMAYIGKVVTDSHAAGVRTVEQWKERNRMFRKDFYEILRAFGIRDRSPVPAETKTMEVWISEYGFSMDIIKEACSRSLNKGNPMKYADSILKGWHEADVRTVGDIAALDEKHRTAENAGDAAQSAARMPGGYRTESRGGFADIPRREAPEAGALRDELRGRNGNLV